MSKKEIPIQTSYFGNFHDHIIISTILCQLDFGTIFHLHLFPLQGRSDPEQAPSIVTVLSLSKEAAVRHQDMAGGVESEEVASGLDGDGGAGDGILLRHNLL